MIGKTKFIQQLKMQFGHFEDPEDQVRHEINENAGEHIIDIPEAKPFDKKKIVARLKRLTKNVSLRKEE